MRSVRFVVVLAGLVLSASVVATAPSMVSADEGVVQRCFGFHRFGAEPVDVAKTADGQTVLAQVDWGWHDSIGCYLVLDDHAVTALRAAPLPQSLPQGQTDVSKRCFAFHKFGAEPVDVAKTADGQTVLARLSWGWHDSIGCYLVLDDTALGVLRTTPSPPAPNDFENIADAMFDRFNQQRQDMGLGAFRLYDPQDDAFISVQEVALGCNDPVDGEEFVDPTLDGIGFAPWTQGSECAVLVTTYHIVPASQRQRVKRDVWDCFTQNTDLNQMSDVSCAGRYTAFGGHVKWLPSQATYAIVTGEAEKAKFASLIPWVQQKLGVRLSETPEQGAADILLHLGLDRVPANCGHALGCNSWELNEHGYRGTIHIASSVGQYFEQVAKHELLHVLVPMGHLPQGNYLMSVRPDDPSQTNELSALEDELLELYVNPYVRDGMTMEQFRRYLVIEG